MDTLGGIVDIVGYVPDVLLSYLDVFVIVNVTGIRAIVIESTELSPEPNKFVAFNRNS